VLFGAPVTTHHLHTLLCGAHMALLSTLPLVYVHGVKGETWRRIVALLLPMDEVYGGLLGTVLGAWLGAIPIPLDWYVHARHRKRCILVRRTGSCAGANGLQGPRMAEMARHDCHRRVRGICGGEIAGRHAVEGQEDHVCVSACALIESASILL
jgi:hypothetical protein